jgi:CcmD family protein
MNTIMSQRQRAVAAGTRVVAAAMVAVLVGIGGASLLQVQVQVQVQVQAQEPVATLARAEAHQAQPPAAARDEYVPIDQIPESDKLPAAPYLIAAYMTVWVLLLLYVWSLWRRLSRVEDELKRLASGSLKS